MKIVFKNILIIFFLAFLVRCDEYEVTSRNYPRVKTLAVSEISSQGARLNAEIIYRGDFEVINYGFVWGLTENPTKLNSDRVVFAENINRNKFSELIESTLREDTTYYVRAFVQTNDYTVYGENVSFLSLGSGAPKISSVSPSEINFCDTLYIKGSNFSYIPNQNVVMFGSERGNILFASDTLIKAFAPDSLTSPSFQVEININGKKVNSNESINIRKPVINSISPYNILIGDTIIIYGDNFTRSKHTNKVIINGEQAKVISASCNSISAIVPAVNSPVQFSLSNLTNKKSEPFTISLLTPTITQLMPEKEFMGNEIELIGYNFGYTQDALTIKVDSLEAEIISHSNESIKIQIPEGIYNKRNTTVSIIVKSKTSSSIDFLLLDPWIRKKNIPKGRGYGGSVGFALNNYGFVGLGAGTGGYNTTEFWKYNPSNNTWTSAANFPGTERELASYFVIEEYAYVCGGENQSGSTNDCWKYNAVNDSWVQVADFPYNFSDAVGLSSHGKGYIITKNLEDNFWKYDPNLDQWIKMPDLQISKYHKVDTGFELNNNLYVHVFLNTRLFYIFNINTNSWSEKNPMPVSDRRSGVTNNSVSSNGYGYILNKNFFMHKYNPQTDSWTRLDAFHYDRWKAFAFEINGILYFGGGIYGKNDMWEYNPSYEK